MYNIPLDPDLYSFITGLRQAHPPTESSRHQSLHGEVSAGCKSDHITAVPFSSRPVMFNCEGLSQNML